MFSSMAGCAHPICEIENKIAENESEKCWFQKAILDLRVKELETEEGILDMRPEGAENE